MEKAQYYHSGGMVALQAERSRDDLVIGHAGIQPRQHRRSVDLPVFRPQPDLPDDCHALGQAAAISEALETPDDLRCFVLDIRCAPAISVRPVRRTPS